MNYQPKTDAEIQAAMMIPDNDVCFAEVKEAANHVSEKGKESIKLKLAIWEDTSIRTYLFVYLTPAFMLLFKHACIALVGAEKYESGNIQAEDFVGKSCNVIIGIEKDKTGQYPDKNKVKDFVVNINTDTTKTNDKKQQTEAEDGGIRGLSGYNPQYTTRSDKMNQTKYFSPDGLPF